MSDFPLLKNQKLTDDLVLIRAIMIAFSSFRLDTGYTVKVSDGSLSQLFYPECYSYHRGTIRPVRWAAVETLKQGQCTSASNVVSEHKKFLQHNIHVHNFCEKLGIDLKLKILTSLSLSLSLSLSFSC